MILQSKAAIPEERNHHGNSHPAALDIERYQDGKKSSFNKMDTAFEGTYGKINIVSSVLKLVTSKAARVRIDCQCHIPTFLHNYLTDSQITMKQRFDENIAGIYKQYLEQKKLPLEANGVKSSMNILISMTVYLKNIKVILKVLDCFYTQQSAFHGTRFFYGCCK